MPKNYELNTEEMLKERFHYMFNKENIGFSFYRGWMPILAGLCVEIDQLLGENRELFHWTQIKEKFGAARFYYAFGGATDIRADLHLENELLSFNIPLSPRTERIGLHKNISELVSTAEKEAATSCFVCGQPAKVQSYGGYLQTLCAEHHPSKLGSSGDASWKRIWELAKPAAPRESE